MKVGMDGDESYLCGLSNRMLGGACMGMRLLRLCVAVLQQGITCSFVSRPSQVLRFYHLQHGESLGDFHMIDMNCLRKQEIFLVARSVVVVVVQGKRTLACVRNITMSDIQFTHFLGAACSAPSTGSIQAQ